MTFLNNEHGFKLNASEQKYTITRVDGDGEETRQNITIRKLDTTTNHIFEYDQLGQEHNVCDRRWDNRRITAIRHLCRKTHTPSNGSANTKTSEE